MRRRTILLGLVLAVGAGIAGAQGPPADPLDGKTFRSVEKLPGGERRDGTVALTHWAVRFKDKSFSWRHYDKVSVGTYAFDAQTGTVTVKGGPDASFDAKTGILTWRQRKYVQAGGVNAQDETPESKVLSQWVGTWKTEVVSKPAEWTPKEVKTTGTITCKRVLGGKFVEESGSSLAPGTEHRVIWGYEPRRKVYRNWFFDSQGNTLEATGTWDAKAKTMTWKSDPGPGLSGTATHRFLDADTYEWTYTIKDAGGKVYLDVKGKHTRSK
jgi:hypothetical protein